MKKANLAVKKVTTMKYRYVICEGDALNLIQHFLKKKKKKRNPTFRTRAKIILNSFIEWMFCVILHSHFFHP